MLIYNTIIIVDWKRFLELFKSRVKSLMVLIETLFYSGIAFGIIRVIMLVDTWNWWCLNNAEVVYWGMLDRVYNLVEFWNDLLRKRRQECFLWSWWEGQFKSFSICDKLSWSILSQRLFNTNLAVRCWIIPSSWMAFLWCGSQISQWTFSRMIESFICSYARVKCF